MTDSFIPDERPAEEQRSAQWTAHGTAAYRRISLALFLAGFATFSLIYCVQPLLPEFAQDFVVAPGVASLALSLTTGLLALAIFAAGAVSQMVPRRGLMFGSMAGAAVLNVAAAWTPSFPLLLMARALEGLVLGGVPAVAMAYLAEEIDPAHLGRAMGLYVAGTAFGGMMGRVGMGLATDLTSWRGAMALLGGLDLVAAVGFALLLPASRNFAIVRGFDPGFHLRAWGAHLRDPRLLRLFALAFLLMSVFVALFNYAGFRLAAPPYRLGQTATSMIFLTYALGMVASSSAGRLADRHGRARTLGVGLALLLAGIALTLSASLVLIVAGITLLTIGFFIGHSVASGWVGRVAHGAKGHAASLYLLFYYLGSSVTGTLGGWFWQHGGWHALAALTAVLTLVGFWVLNGLREAG
ncbi:MFS transporter [Sphingomonas sp. PL-96]|uniref:MFS transporter n=1 Tax=Sphingomonas sp. PL-96 TaxID=2887201 RepID=UPI001E45CA56|nr:MFS transporter [Sphingomonas sp. PL-96]MCC2975795.1 MFS transporter [Sphingomonas sp. PL-96]